MRTAPNNRTATPAAETVERMAHAIADLIRGGRGANGTVTATDLHAKGFSPDQVAVHGPAAKARAARIVSILGVE